MYQIAIVEDEDTAAETIHRYLESFFAEHSLFFQFWRFPDAVSFLENYKGYDIVFMDIRMPHMDGMEAAARLRKIDQTAILIFVTNMAQYAMRGYEVDALDFIVKPVSYYNFAMKLEKALRVCQRRQANRIVVSGNGSLNVLSTDEILYIEVSNHDLRFHTRTGTISSWGSLGKIEKQVNPALFVRCNVSYLVNLSYVTAVYGDTVIVGGDHLHITRAKKVEFMKRLTDFLGG